MFEVSKKNSTTRFLAGQTRLFSFLKIQTVQNNTIKSSRTDSRAMWITPNKIPEAGFNLIIRNLTTKTEPESENVMELDHLKQLSIREYFIEFCSRKTARRRISSRKTFGLLSHTAYCNKITLSGSALSATL
jgi:pectate lyase